MIIELKNIGFAYKKEKVLNNISTVIRHGDFVAFVGPNGSGKSTLIRIVDGLLKPDTGAVMLNDEDIRNKSREEIAKSIAYVPQSEGECLTTIVYDTVLMGRKPHIGWRPAKRDHSAVVKVLKMLGLESVSMCRINELSGGQRQRVFIARALAQEPTLLLLDEPTSSLDLKHSLEVLDLLRSLTNNKITVVIAIHDLNMAARYCNHIIMLNNGKIFAEGNKEIFTQENIQKLYGVNVKLINDGEHVVFVPI